VCAVCRKLQGTPKTDERFINWMRIAALPNFRKLWGKIDTDLKKGDVVGLIGPPQHSCAVASCGMVLRCDTAWHGFAVWHGMAWFEVWHGLARFAVWHGMAQFAVWHSELAMRTSRACLVEGATSCTSLRKRPVPCAAPEDWSGERKRGGEYGAREAPCSRQASGFCLI